MTQRPLLFTLLALLSASPLAQADCSAKLFGGDPLGTFTKASAFTVVNSHPPKALFILSDITPKGLAVPAGPGPAFITGTPFNDYIYAPNSSLAAGLNGGYDVMMLANPEQAKPGENEVDVMQGGAEVNGAERGSLFILGDHKKRYYAGKSHLFDADHDYAYIDRFLPGYSKIRLNGQASDYRLTWITGLFSNAIAGTAIVTKNTCDVIGFVRNVLLTNTADSNFEYASAPSSTTAVSTASQTVYGIDQVSGLGATSWPGAVTATDDAGNVYMTFGSSSSSVHGVGGNGSFYLVKYDANGNRLWTKKHGLNSGNDNQSGIQTPISITTYGNNVYVAGVTWGPYGGPKPGKLLGLADGIIAFIAKFDGATGELNKVVQKKPSTATTANPSWVLSTDNAGNLFFGGSAIEGINLPFASAYVMKVDGKTLETITSFGNNGSVFFRNGPVTVLNSLNLLADATDNLQLTNFTTGIKFTPDGSGIPGNGSIYVAGVSDNGSFFGSQPGWNSAWYTKLNANTGGKEWPGNRSCDLRNGCIYTGGYSLSSPGADTFLWSIDVDTSGNLYLGGETGGSISAVGHAETLVAAKGSKQGKGDGFIAKIDPSGNLRWLQHIGTSASDNLRAMRVDGTAIYATGETRAFSRGRTDIYSAKLDTLSGNLLKVLSLGSERFDVSFGIALSNDKVYLSGLTEGSVAKSSAGGVEAFLISVDKSSF